MATKQAKTPEQILNRKHVTGVMFALAMFYGLTGCDQSIPIDLAPDNATGGAPLEATGGVGGAAGATTDAPSAGNGGAGGGTRTISPLPAGCAPISTTPSVVNPCGQPTAIAYSADGQLLAMGFNSYVGLSVRVWRLTDGMPLPDFDGQGDSELTYGVAFSPDGKVLAAAGYRAAVPDVPFVRLWDVATGALTRTLQTNLGQYADSVAFSGDGRLLATGGYDGAVELWRVADGARVLSIDVPTTAHNVHFSPDDSKIIIATVDMKARVYDVVSGALVLGPLDIAAEMADAEFSPDGKQIATTWQTTANAGGVEAVRIYDGQTGELLQSLPGHTAYISHTVWVDQNRIVSNDWSGVTILWQRNASGAFALTRSWSAHGQSMGLAVSPDKKTIVTGPAGNEAAGFVFLAL